MVKIKKILARVSFMMLLVFVVVSCDNEPYEGELINVNNDCQLALQTTNEAAQNYLMATVESSNVLCQAYKDALVNQIEICGDENGELQEIIVFLGNCINLDPCTVAQNETEIAFQDYLNAPILDYEITCLAYAQAIENEIMVCGDNGALRDLINELGDCEPVDFQIPGNWRLVAIVSDVARDLDNDGELTNNYLEDLSCYSNESIDFNANGTGTLFYRSYPNIVVSAAPGTFDNFDYSVNCIEERLDVNFTWEQINLNMILVTLDTDGTEINFFRNGNSIFLVKRDGFVATGENSTVNTIVEDVILEYVRI